MTEELYARRVKVSFVGAPPAHQVERASEVSEVEIDGSILHCLACCSFQPFLEALRGHEVVSLTSTSSAARQRLLQIASAFDLSGAPIGKSSFSTSLVRKS
jgi:hypothetical protein